MLLIGNWFASLTRTHMSLYPRYTASTIYDRHKYKWGFFFYDHQFLGFAFYFMINYFL